MRYCATLQPSCGCIILLFVVRTSSSGEMRSGTGHSGLGAVSQYRHKLAVYRR
jgi:hypothetical protein